MFENLTNKLESVFSKLRRAGKLTEKNIQEGLKEVRLALLEADVNFRVVKDFIKSVEGKALGQQVLSSITPGQQIVKIVHDELINLMGEHSEKIEFSQRPPTVIMLAGLQGSGKTTTAGKLGNLLKKEGHRPLLVPADPYRPAAIAQLKTIGKQAGIEVYSSETNISPVITCKKALEQAKGSNLDVVIIDTAGRLHIDQELMEELKNIISNVPVNEKLLVADSMAGQDAVNIAKEFNSNIELTGIILTKMDGDARGGAALSIKAVTQKPIKFIGMGEKLDALEVFHPERMASRILGMGDILSLVEKAQKVVDEKKTLELEKKIREETFTLEDFKDQLLQIKSMGPLEELIGMIPGLGNTKKLKDLNVDEKEFGKIEAIINSMTGKERLNYTLINGNRRKRIARGSGTTIQDVNKLLKQFAQMKKMMKVFASGKKGKFMKLPFMQ